MSDEIDIRIYELDDGIRIGTLKIARISVETSVRMQNALASIIEPKPRVFVLDMKNVEHIDSAGIQFLAVLNQAVKQYGGTCVYTQLNEKVDGLLEITQVNRLLTIRPTLKEALDEFRVDQ